MTKWKQDERRVAVVERDHTIGLSVADAECHRRVRIMSRAISGELKYVEIGETPSTIDDPMAPMNGHCRIGYHQLGKVVSLLCDILERYNARRPEDYAGAAAEGTQPERTASPHGEGAGGQGVPE